MWAAVVPEHRGMVWDGGGEILPQQFDSGTETTATRDVCWSMAGGDTRKVLPTLVHVSNSQGRRVSIAYAATRCWGGGNRHGGVWTAKTVKQPPQQPTQPQYANYWAPLTRKRHIQHSPSTPTTGLCERGNDTSRSTGRSGRQKAATRRNMRREERVTVQGPVKKQQPDGM